MRWPFVSRRKYDRALDALSYEIERALDALEHQGEDGIHSARGILYSLWVHLR